MYNTGMEQRHGTEVWNGSFKQVWNGSMERGYGTGVGKGCGPRPCSGPSNLTCTHIYICVGVDVSVNGCVSVCRSVST